MAKKLIPMAISYDFDGTLAPGNMQEYDFIPALNMRSKQFWGSVNDLAKKHEMDQILAYMYVMLEEAQKANSRGSEGRFQKLRCKYCAVPWCNRLVQAHKYLCQGKRGKSGTLHYFFWYSGNGGRHTHL